MRLRALELIPVAVPLRTTIRHASHTRRVSDNLLVRAELSDGSVGWGEGLPRDYVTGETIASALEMLAGTDWATAFGSPRDLPEAVAAIARLTLPEIESDPRRRVGNAARCALEIALLDAVTRSAGIPLGDVLPMLEDPGLELHPTPRRVRYSGAITSASTYRERVTAYKLRIYGFKHVKLKVGLTGQDDPQRLRHARRILGKSIDIRLDANEAWRPDDLRDRIAPLLPFGPSAIEQPVPNSEVAALAEFRATDPGVAIMLDESLCSLADAEAAIASATCDLFNVRLSKCGGLIPSARILARANRAGLGCQLGCHPGETGILSAAGRHYAARVVGLKYVEGSYDRHVLKRNVIREDITFHYGGSAPPLTGPGLGVTVDPEAVDRLALERREIRYD